MRDSIPLIRLTETDSTQDAARALLRQQAAPFVVSATQQTGGYGRQARAWEHLPSNLAATWAFPAPEDPLHITHLGYLGCLALRSALITLGIQPDRLSSKWPNDMLLDGVKMAGILVERVENAVLFGIGVNISAAPRLYGSPAISLFDAGYTALTSDALLPALSCAFTQQFTRLEQLGAAALRADWLSSAAYLGETLRADTPQGVRIGRFLGLDISGRICLDNQVYSSADITRARVLESV